MPIANPSLAAAAGDYLAAGLCVLPARRDQKRPTVSWKAYQSRRPTGAEIGAWFANGHDALCILAGAVSRNTEMLDFDRRAELHEPWCAKVRAAAPGLLERLVVSRTQRDGRHVYYRCEDGVSGNLKLAQRKGDDGIETLIETRGEGGLFLCSPTEGYEVLQGSLCSMPVLTGEERDILLRCASELNQYEPPAMNGPATGAPARATLAQDGRSPLGSPPGPPAPHARPGDDFNARGDVRAILEAHGWTRFKPGDNEEWCRPGKSGACSATLKDGNFFVFSSNASPFEQRGSYKHFAVYAMLECGGDFEQAARCLREAGFGGDGATDSADGLDISAITGPCGAQAEENSHTSADVDHSAPCGEDSSGRPPSSPQVPDPGPFPEELFDVPGFIGDVVQYARSVAHRDQPVLALAGAVMLQAVLVARKVRDERGNRTNLYTVAVALSSAGKDKPREVNDRILELAGVDLLGNEEVTSDAAVLTALEARPAILFQFDEFGRFLRTMGDPRKSPNIYAAITTFMRLYSNANRTYRGKGYADAKRNRTIVQPCASIYGTSTPRAMYESLTKEGIEDGFVGRLIFFETLTRPPRVRRPDADPPQHLIEAAMWWNNFVPGDGNTAGVYPRPRLVEATEEAEAIFDALAKLADAEMALDETYAPIWGRAEEKACRLALVYACSRCKENPMIDDAAARWACRMSEYTTRRTILIASQWISDGMFDSRQKRVLRVIQEAGTISQSELCRKTQALTPKERTEVLENLVLGGLIRVSQVETKGRHRVSYEAL